MEIKVVDRSGQERTFATPADAVSWGYKEVQKINQEIHEFIQRRDEIVAQLGLKFKKSNKSKTEAKSSKEALTPA